MTGSHILLSSERTDWQSPQPFLALVRAVHPIDVDPCTTMANPTGARRIFVQGRACGLRGRWVRQSGQAYVNPPYGKHLSGPVAPTKKIYRRDKRTGERRLVGIGTGWGQRIALEVEATTVLVPVRTETEWWGVLYRWSNLVLFWASPALGKRIAFVNPDTGAAQEGSNLASCVFYRGPAPDRFAEVFSPHGLIVPGGMRCAP